MIFTFVSSNCLHMSFADRIESILQHYSLTPKELSEKIKVQRSNISHLLSGRNKPSVAFLTKISETFPDLSMHWLLHGKGKMITNVNYVENERPTKHADLVQSTVNKGKQDSKENDQLVKIVNKVENDPVPNGNFEHKNRNLTKIICVYSDGSTKVFSPDHSG